MQVTILLPAFTFVLMEQITSLRLLAFADYV
jgi:hypothetical protein